LNGNNKKPLTTESLQEAWNAFIEKLSFKKNHSAVTNFKMASLEVLDENSFDVITQSNMHLKFIEAERSDLIHFMQQYFNNRLLKYQLILIENDAVADTGEKPLNTKQQYQLLADEFPLIKELKDRLKLDLDY
jgi:DNA polymerase-3 subunit gamma/tau